MTTRNSMEKLKKNIEDKIEFAKEELDEARKLGHNTDEQYTNAQSLLQQAERDIEKMKNSANAEQREELHRMHLRIYQILNDMILDRNDINDYR
ncbi:uncharacterized protein DUF2524 [Melghiribacillus thermohalophilus]|uniref:Uncharacterized protein DUF2524 n=1 Tax=Melghiribacillus thermohalophilus TaxID=1324956 RepID=A0A4R3MLG2_9BACI|nr:YtzC family protein [Melghiribacillus thermohalophilus]TCT14718.1 uncharacterized protein DUF2524 [Melghiribacillus thermohalophilus]